MDLTMISIQFPVTWLRDTDPVPIDQFQINDAILEKGVNSENRN